MESEEKSGMLSLVGGFRGGFWRFSNAFMGHWFRENMVALANFYCFSGVTRCFRGFRWFKGNQVVQGDHCMLCKIGR